MTYLCSLFFMAVIPLYMGCVLLYCIQVLSLYLPIREVDTFGCRSLFSPL